MFNLCFGMKVINVTQVPGGSYSHPNNAMDLAGSDNGVDFWYAQGNWKCIAGPWGNGTYFFTAVDDDGTYCKVHCADGKDRFITLALTHSLERYIDTVVGKTYKNGQPMYEEGTKGFATGNHIHLEIANGVQVEKTYDKSLGVYRMANELNPFKVMYVRKGFSKVTASSALVNSGKSFLYCDDLIYNPPKPADEEDYVLYFVADTGPCYVRKALTFNVLKRNNSTVLAMIPKGGKAEITHFTQRHEKDGYEWCQVLYKTGNRTYNGYCQMDMKAYKIVKESKK